MNHLGGIVVSGLALWSMVIFLFVYGLPAEMAKGILVFKKKKRKK